MTARTMNITIEHGTLLKGKPMIPSSKSFLHRTLICAALSDGETRIYTEGTLAGDTLETIGALSALGTPIHHENGVIRVEPIEDVSEAHLIIRESGATLRFILCLCALKGIPCRITRGNRLAERPILPLVDVLKNNGADMEIDGTDIYVKSGTTNNEFTLDGSVSSQFFSGLLLALPLTGGRVSSTTPPVSVGYIRMTERVTEKFGRKNVLGEYAEKGVYVSPGSVFAEADASCASVWKVLNCFGSELSVGTAESQPDGAVGEALARLGGTIDVSGMPDSLPVLAAAAAGINGNTAFTGTERLKYKESDRIESVCAMIRSLGGTAFSGVDKLTVCGSGKLYGGTVDSFGDHRIVMAAAAAAAVCSGDVEIRDAEAVDKSYPDFFGEYVKVGGRLKGDLL